MQDCEKQEGDRLGQVEGVVQLGGGQDAVDILQAGVDICRAAGGGAGEQCPRVGEHERVMSSGHMARWA
jgi:hypothetical protein